MITFESGGQHKKFIPFVFSGSSKMRGFSLINMTFMRQELDRRLQPSPLL